MTQEHDRPDDRMEALLRLWGAEQTSGQQDLPPAPPVPRPVRLDVRYALLYAGCVAAGALVAIGAMLMARNGTDRPTGRGGPVVARGLRPTTAPTTAPVEEPRLQRRSAQEAKVRAKQAVAIQALRVAEEELAESHARQGALQKELASANTRTQTMTNELAALRRKLTKMNRLQETMDRLDVQVKTLRNRQETAQANVIRLRKELTTLRRQHQAKYQGTLKVYLTALAPEHRGMEALQVAMRTSRVLERGMKLRRLAENDEMRKTLDRIEAMLIRLDFLDTDDVSALVRFEKQLKRSGLLPEIASALNRSQTSPAMQAFLAEVDLIFSSICLENSSGEVSGVFFRSFFRRHPCRIG